VQNVNPVFLEIMKQWRSHVHVSRCKKTNKTTFKKADHGLVDKEAKATRGDNVAADSKEGQRQ
jgi:hypothetical protein